MTRKNHLALLLFIAAAYLGGFFLLGRWQTSFYYGDTNGYYLHLVSFFVNGDVGDYGASIERLLEVNPNSVDPREDVYGIRLTEKGRRYIKYTLGVPVMETPFFLLAHAYASWSPHFAADGWSKPYLLLVGLSTLCYLLVGMYLLLGVLERYFRPREALLSVLTIALATNLFYHGTYVTMAHGFLFFDYCLLIWLSDKFYRSPRPGLALAIGAVVGLIALTRVPEVISLLIPLLWGVSSWAGLRERLRFFFVERYGLLLLAGAGLLAVFALQIAYWHYVSGQFIFNPYDGEGFNFLQPNIYKGWFHFANGWLIYTPVMALSLIGWLFLPRYAPGKLLPIALFVFLHAYIHYSYYAWTYFPGLGSRPMVETYPLLAFGLAACIAVMLRRRWLAVLLGALLLFFTWLNLFQTWQMKEGIIWSERGNQAFYFETFGALKPHRNALLAYDLHERQPDSTKLQRIGTLWSEGFEHDRLPGISSEIVRAGEKALFIPSGELVLEGNIPLEGVSSGDWLRVRLDAYVRGHERIWNRDWCAGLVLIFQDEQGKRRKYRRFKISPYIGNESGSIWHTGETDQWADIHFFIQVPRRLQPGWSLKAYLLNDYEQKLFVDELRIDHYRRR
jgi:hypothetical protein